MVLDIAAATGIIVMGIVQDLKPLVVVGIIVYALVLVIFVTTRL